MASRIDRKSLCIGLLVGLILLLAVGADRNKEEFQLSMAASDNWVVYGKINTATGDVETWKYMLHSREIPRRPEIRD